MLALQHLAEPGNRRKLCAQRAGPAACSASDMPFAQPMRPFSR